MNKIALTTLSNNDSQRQAISKALFFSVLWLKTLFRTYRMPMQAFQLRCKYIQSSIKRLKALYNHVSNFVLNP